MESLDRKKEKLILFDTTLRDGEQSPGVSLTVNEKVEIAKQLSRLGVDVCEAGFPVASEADFLAVQTIAKEVGSLVENRKSGRPMTICGLARATMTDIKRAHEAVRHAKHHRIHTFLATSDIHLKWKLRISREECIKKAVDAVKYARSLCEDVEFSPEDAGRSDRDFLCQVLAAVIEAGATTLNIPDTVGYNTPDEYSSLIKFLVENVPNSNKVVWSTHCHNDLGLATANTLAAICSGARQVEVTINGIGERAGNTSLEEVVMTIHTHPSKFPVYTDIHTQLIFRTSQLVSQKTGMRVQPNKAIVGENAFAHQSGIHQDGMLKHHQTYEIMKPEVVGQPSTTYILGKLSGRNGLRKRLEDLGYTDISNDPQKFDSFFERFKNLADTKNEVVDSDLIALITDGAGESQNKTFLLKHVQVVTSSADPNHDNPSTLSTATVSMVVNADPPVERTDAAIGNGPVHAIFKCITRLLGKEDISCLVDYEVKSVTGGDDALGRVTVRLTAGPQSSPKEENAKKKFYLGHGVHCDVLMASALAYVDALNKMANDHALAENLADPQEAAAKKHVSSASEVPATMLVEE